METAYEQLRADLVCFKVDEVASRLNLSKSQVYQLIAEGELPSVRIGRSVRIPAEALRRWLEKRSEHTHSAIGKD